MTALGLPAIRAQYEDAPRLLVAEWTAEAPASVYEEADGLETICTIPGYYSPEAQNALAHQIAAAPSIVAQLVAVVERVEGLAAAWEARGEHDMKFSKTIPDEDIAMVLLTEGASMVENARHIRNAIREGQ